MRPLPQLRQCLRRPSALPGVCPQPARPLPSSPCLFPPHPPGSDGQGSVVSRGSSRLRSAAQGSLSAGWPGWGLPRRGLALTRRVGLPSEVGARGGGAQQMWGLTPWGLVTAEGIWAWFMAVSGWGTHGLGQLLYELSVPGRGGSFVSANTHQSGNRAEITATSEQESSHVWQMSTALGSSVSVGPGRPP